MNKVLPWLLAAGLAAGWWSEIDGQEPAGPQKGEGWQAFQVSKLSLEREKTRQAYLPFLRVPTLSCGLYYLPAGGRDDQKPHELDEVYYVISGRGRLKVGAEDLPVEPGTVVYVQAGADHRFHDLQEDLEVLVFFSAATAEIPGQEKH